ncbi:uncharacterized protein sS8_0229 [Methylocaldum marinum]|uniref:Lipoprotein n=1 Tax=Methylocaldum marinum TaxID=1432792 RepID=A0A286P3H5_9GAMM|nr:hypothetical protein [Methylocaldum marinum]BBA32197.1 uncharacterized protein sS8_0229 [Methylocaldum marinum]
MFRSLILSIAILIYSCSNSNNQNTLVLSYSDFGPQVIASEIIGMEWWQWQSHGESRPTKYDIKVVIYNKIDIANVKKLYPVLEKQNQDYRYLEKYTALKYLDEKIKENTIEKVTNTLIKTRDKIKSTFNE